MKNLIGRMIAGSEAAERRNNRKPRVTPQRIPRPAFPPATTPTMAEPGDATSRILAEHRAKEFRAELKPDRFHPDEHVLSVTTNGNQWQSIGLLPSEQRKVAGLLCPELEDLIALADAVAEFKSAVAELTWCCSAVRDLGDKVINAHNKLPNAR